MHLIRPSHDILLYDNYRFFADSCSSNELILAGWASSLGDNISDVTCVDTTFLLNTSATGVDTLLTLQSLYSIVETSTASPSASPVRLTTTDSPTVQNISAPAVTMSPTTLSPTTISPTTTYPVSYFPVSFSPLTQSPTIGPTVSPVSSQPTTTVTSSAEKIEAFEAIVDGRTLDAREYAQNHLNFGDDL